LIIKDDTKNNLSISFKAPSIRKRNKDLKVNALVLFLLQIEGAKSKR